MISYDIYGIGNALLDTEYEATDEFLRRNRVDKGRMTLIDNARRSQLLAAVNSAPHDVAAGGSAANAIYAAQGFGCRNYFAGLVCGDAVGNTFRSELAKAGIDTLPPDENPNAHSGQCLIFVTKDGQRSMNTSLGISESIDTNHVDETTVATSQWTYVEGYLASSITGANAAKHAMEIAKANGRKTSLTLSDVSIVENFRAALAEIMGQGVDLIFCNVEEALAWGETDRLDIAGRRLLDIGRNAVVTVSEKGCYLSTAEQVNVKVDGFPVQPVDSNGAGDMYAGALLASLRQGTRLDQAARFANFAASHIVRQFGPRLKSFEAYGEIAGHYR